MSHPPNGVAAVKPFHINATGEFVMDAEGDCVMVCNDDSDECTKRWKESAPYEFVCTDCGRPTFRMDFMPVAWLEVSPE